MRTGELDEAQSFLEGVMASVAAGVVVLDSDLRVRTWNSGAEDLWGLRTAEVQGQSFFSLDFGLPTPAIRDTVTACMGPGGKPGGTEVVAVNRRGRTITCTISCSPLNDARNGVVLLMKENSSERDQRPDGRPTRGDNDGPG